MLFDWDNTLIDGWAAIAVALNAVFDRHGLPHWSSAEAQANVRGSLRDSFPVMFGAGWEQDAEVFYATLRARHLEQLVPMPGAVPLIAACRAVAPLGIVSNKTGEFLRREVAHLGWSGHFGAVVGAGDARADKPDPAPLLMALRDMGVPPGGGVWFIGDTALDMRAARAAGCEAILLGTAAHDGGLANARPDRHYLDANQLVSELSMLAS